MTAFRLFAALSLALGLFASVVLADNEKKPDVVYVPTPLDVALRMLELAEVRPSDLVYDLGSGDGRIVIAAAKKYRCKAVGYEIVEDLVQRSRELAREEGVEELVSIEKKDLFKLDLSGAQVITAYLGTKPMQRLIPQFNKLKPGARIVSHQFEIPGIKAGKVEKFKSADDGDTHTIYLYTAPLKESKTP